MSMSMWAFVNGERIWSSDDGWQITVAQSGKIQIKNCSKPCNIDVSQNHINIKNADIPFHVLRMLVNVMSETRRFTV